jgi:hypothetical protein
MGHTLNFTRGRAHEDKRKACETILQGDKMNF